MVKPLLIVTAIGALLAGGAHAQNVFIRDVPDYSWHAGCFGTASGNLMGFWDRNGFPNMYTGPTGDGVAPLDSAGANVGIRSLWASRAGFDGRPANMPGHIDDYWEYFDGSSYSYESAAPDPYQLAGRQEHAPDSIGDFIGASQNKWSDLDGECSGNIDAFSFNFWDKTGARRENFVPPVEGGEPIRDIQSGWREWVRSRGYHADTFSQLVDINPDAPAESGFTFEDLKAEIDAGYPVLLFLQNPGEYSRSLKNMERANPNVHAMIAYGYVESETGARSVRYRTSWADGDRRFRQWEPFAFEALLRLRGVIGFRPLPQIKEVQREGSNVLIKWDGPASILEDGTSGELWPAHKYIVEKASMLAPDAFQPVGESTSELEITVPDVQDSTTFFRLRLISNPRPEVQ